MISKVKVYFAHLSLNSQKILFLVSSVFRGKNVAECEFQKISKSIYLKRFVNPLLSLPTLNKEKNLFSSKSLNHENQLNLAHHSMAEMILIVGVRFLQFNELIFYFSISFQLKVILICIAMLLIGNAYNYCIFQAKPPKFKHTDFINGSYL